MDESTFESFYEQTRDSLRSFLRGMMRGDAVADDIFQESYIRFLQSEVRMGNEAEMKSYLFRISANLMNDHWRRVKRAHSRREKDIPVQTTIDPGKASDARGIVGDVLHQLNHQQQVLLWMAYVEGYKHKEIAGVLKLREGSVRVLLHRARAKFMDVCKRMGITMENAI